MIRGITWRRLEHSVETLAKLFSELKLVTDNLLSIYEKPLSSIINVNYYGNLDLFSLYRTRNVKRKLSERDTSEEAAANGVNHTMSESQVYAYMCQQMVLHCLYTDSSQPHSCNCSSFPTHAVSLYTYMCIFSAGELLVLSISCTLQNTYKLVEGIHVCDGLV